jgi:hypothetical protein
LRQAFKALTLPASPQPVETEKRGKGDDTGKGRAGIPQPFRQAARRVTINFRRIARMAFAGAKQGAQREPPPPVVDDASPVSDSLDYFWQQHWQNDSSAEIPDTDNSRDFSGDFDGGPWPSLDL